jgi:hypothetical protein
LPSSNSAVAERHVRPVHRVVEGRGTDLRVSVRRGQPEDQEVTLADALTAGIAVLDRPAPDEVPGRGVLPKHLGQRLADTAAPALQGQRELIIGEHQPQCVPDPVSGGLLGCGHDDEQADDDLLI